MRSLPVRFRKLAPIPEGRHYFVTGAGCWGKGPTLETALQMCAQASSSTYGKFKPASSRVMVQHVDPEAFVDGDDMIVTPAGKDRPVEVCRFK